MKRKINCKDGLEPLPGSANRNDWIHIKNDGTENEEAYAQPPQTEILPPHAGESPAETFTRHYYRKHPHATWGEKELARYEDYAKRYPKNATADHRAACIEDITRTVQRQEAAKERYQKAARGHPPHTPAQAVRRPKST